MNQSLECRAISSYYTIENKIGATMYIIVGYSGPIVTDELEVPTDIWISDFYKVSTSKEKLKYRIASQTYEVWDDLTEDEDDPMDFENDIKPQIEALKKKIGIE